jgi:hypothetical protein
MRWVATALLSAGLLAGCGGGARATSSTTSFMSEAIAYSNCMRSHGVPDFPDPDRRGRLHMSFGPGSDLSPDSPAFQFAERVCGRPPSEVTASQEHQQFLKGLNGAVCMRANGVLNYRDPEMTNGKISLFFTPAIINSPAFRKAAKKCGLPRGVLKGLPCGQMIGITNIRPGG